MTIRFDKKVERVSRYVIENTTEAIFIYHIDPGTVVTATAKVIVETEDKAQKVEFNLYGLFSNMGGTEIEHGGESKRTDDSSTDFDAWLSLGGIRSLNLIVQNPKHKYAQWSAEIELTIRRDDADYIPTYPRMQMTIVGMEEAKKLGWAGLKDGINYVLAPTIYFNLNVLPFGSSAETWYFGSDKGAALDTFRLTAIRVGNGFSWTTTLSRFQFRWSTFSGDHGTGIYQLWTAKSSFGIGGMGHLRDRVLANHATINPSGTPVTFLWSKYDVQGWKGY